MELKTEGNQVVLVKHNGVKVGSISQLDTDSLKAYRLVLDIFKFEGKIGSAVEISYIEDNKETELGTFEIEKCKIRFATEGFVVLNEANLKRKQ